MDIKVNVESIDLAEHIGTHYDEDGDRVPGGTLADLIVRQLIEQFVKTDTYRGLAGRIREVREDEIRTQLAPVITEALTTPIQSTNAYGERTGSETTLRELIAAEARRYLTERSEGYNAKGTRLQVAVREAVDAAFRAEIADEVKKAKDAVATQLGATVAELVAGAVREALAKR
jgi:hypothetical protein